MVWHASQISIVGNALAIPGYLSPELDGTWSVHEIWNLEYLVYLCGESWVNPLPVEAATKRSGNQKKNTHFVVFFSFTGLRPVLPLGHCLQGEAWPD